MNNTGRCSRRQIQGWVANRFYYQENIPRKDAAILANCAPERRLVEDSGMEVAMDGLQVEV